MGLLRRLLGQEKAESNPFGAASPTTPPGGEEEPIVSLQSGPASATWTSVNVNGRELPAAQAGAFRAAFEQLGNLASMGSGQVFDLRGITGLREQVLGAVHDNQHDPQALQAAVFGALKEHGVMAGAEFGAPAVDPVSQIERLDALRRSGALSDAEFQAQKTRLLGEL